MPPPLVAMAYFVAVDGQPTGPHNEAGLKGLVMSGKLTGETKVWKEVTVRYSPSFRRDVVSRR